MALRVSAQFEHMRRISSTTTFVSKRVFPIVWFGLIAVFVVVGVIAMAGQKHLPVPFFVAPVAMGLVGFFIMKQLVFDLVDQVWDDGDALVVRNRGREIRIDLANIINVSHAMFTNPPRITLTLREPCEFGKEITFSPPHGFLPSSRSKLATELIERIDERRRCR